MTTWNELTNKRQKQKLLSWLTWVPDWEQDPEIVAQVTALRETLCPAQSTINKQKKIVKKGEHHA